MLPPISALQYGDVLGHGLPEELLGDPVEGGLDVLPLEGRGLLVGGQVGPREPVLDLLHGDLPLGRLVCLVPEHEEGEVVRVLGVRLNQEVLPPQVQVFKTLRISDVVD